MPIFCRIELIKYIFVYGWNKSNTVLFIEYKIYLGIVGRLHVQVFNQAVNYFFIFLFNTYLFIIINEYIKRSIVHRIQNIFWYSWPAPCASFYSAVN